MSKRLDHVCVRPDPFDRHRRIRKPSRRPRTTQATLRYRLPSHAVKRRNHPVLIPNQLHERHQTASMLLKNNENLIQIHRTRLLPNAAQTRETPQKYRAGPTKHQNTPCCHTNPARHHKCRPGPLDGTLNRLRARLPPTRNAKVVNVNVCQRSSTADPCVARQLRIIIACQT